MDWEYVVRFCSSFCEVICKVWGRIKFTTSLQNLFIKVCNKIDNVLEKRNIPFNLSYSPPTCTKFIQSLCWANLIILFPSCKKTKLNNKGPLEGKKKNHKSSCSDLKVRAMRIGSSYTMKFSDGLNPAKKPLCPVYRDQDSFPLPIVS